MKSVLSDKCCKKEEKPFPKLMITESYESIVLMISERKGTFLHLGRGSERHIGEVHSDLTPSSMKDYEGDVCLTND